MGHFKGPAGRSTKGMDHLDLSDLESRNGRVPDPSPPMVGGEDGTGTQREPFTYLPSAVHLGQLDLSQHVSPLAALRAARQNAEAAPPFDPEPLDLRAIRDAGCEPDWIVRGIAARRQITIASADTGAGKSWLAQSLAVAVCTAMNG